MRCIRAKYLAGFISIVVLLYFYTDILPTFPQETIINTLKTGLKHDVIFEYVRGKRLEKIFMVIFIPSKPGAGKWREHVRTKGLNISPWKANEFEGVPEECLRFKVMFVVGKTKENGYSDDLLHESSMHDDLYLVETMESLLALNEKLLWALRKSVEIFDFTYFIKTDHDTMIDLPHLVTGLNLAPRQNLYTGKCDIKLKSTPYKQTFDYCKGGGYVISRDLVEKITELDDNETNVPIPFEDGLSGWLISRVVQKHNISGALIPKHDDHVLQNVSNSRNFFFIKWFYHYLKLLHWLDKTFECRRQADPLLCPSMNYKYLTAWKKGVKCVCNEEQLLLT